MGVNVLLFLVFQIGVEPWRRNRLVKGFEDKVMEALEREGSAVEAPPTEARIAQSVDVQEAPKATTPADAGTEKQIPTAADTFPKAPMQVQEDTISEVILVESSSSSGSKLDLQPQLPMSTFDSIKEWIRDMFSERQIVLRRVDVTTAMLEGAAAGAGVALAGALVLLLRLRS